MAIARAYHGHSTDRSATALKVVVRGLLGVGAIAAPRLVAAGEQESGR